jgi:hypothetical protein
VGRILPPAAVLLLFACAAPPDSSARTPPGPTADGRGLGVHPLPVGTPVDARPAAIVNGRFVVSGELMPLLYEAAGATVLQEVADDRLVAAAAEEAGVLIDAGEVEAERRLFYRSLSEDPDQAVRLAQQVRERQGLGRSRFDRLLRRNAMLRAMVAGGVTVADESVRRMHEGVHGPKRQARLIVAAGLPDAEGVIRRLDAGEPFADVAVEVSTDASAARGGLLEPISRVDPRYPEALRQALWALSPDGVSSPILLDNGCAVLLLVREIDADGVGLEEARPRLEELVRLEQERILMDRKIRQLRAGVTINVIDESLRESWEWRQRARAP